MAAETYLADHLVLPKVSKDDSTQVVFSGQVEFPPLGTEQLRVLTALWLCEAPLTSRQLAQTTGICSADVKKALSELRARGLLRCLNTVIESYLASEFPDNVA
jgi:DNA-binding MarR family transcriptional regulator